MDQNIKPIWQSKTVWINLLMALAAFLPSVHALLVASPEVVGAIVAVVNVVLRLISKDKVQIL